MLKAGTVLLAMCMMVVACISPASAVSYNRTMDMYIYGERCFGEVTLYPSMATACTYCEWEPAGKQVYVEHNFKDKNGYDGSIYEAMYWDTFQYNNDTLLIASTGSTSIAYINVCARSKHRVKVDHITWTYEDPNTEGEFLVTN